MIDGQKIFDHPIKNYQRTYDNIRKVMTDQGDDHRTGFLFQKIG